MAYKKTAHRRRRVRSSRRKNAKSRKVMRGGKRVSRIGTINYDGGRYIGQYMEEEFNDYTTSMPLDPRPHTKYGNLGEITWENGASYRGEWKNGLKHGNGEMRQSDGIVFKGTWINDMPDGNFTVTEPNGSVSAIHADDIEDYNSPCLSLDPLPDTKDIHFGEITWENGASYRGEWKNVIKHGNGEMRRSDGIVFKGTWINDRPYGMFTVTEPNGSVSTIHADDIDDYASPGSPLSCS